MDIKLAAENTKKLLPKCKNMMLEFIDGSSKEHIEYMLDSIITEKITGDKAHRWLGWAQAMLCCRGAATLEELKQINKQ